MKLIHHLRAASLAVLLATPSLCGAAAIYDISLDTSPLIGHTASPFSLAFQFNDGSGLGDENNTAALSDFQYGAGGSAAGLPTLFGGASGSLTSGVTIVDNSFFNAFIQPFVPGSLLSFRLQTSTNLDAGGTPDEFSFSILDNTLTELPTNGFFDVFVVMDIDSANPVPQAFSSDPTRSPAGAGSGITMAAPLVTVASPEPSTLILFGLGLIFGMSRRIGWRRQGRVRRDFEEMAVKNICNQPILLPVALCILLTGFSQNVAAQVGPPMLVGSPDPVNFAFGGPTTRIVNISLSGAPVTLTDVSTSIPGGVPNWLQAVANGPSTVLVTVDPTAVPVGGYFGFVDLFAFGAFGAFQVNLGSPPTGPFCFTLGGVGTLARAEGLSELVGGLALGCVGGTPTAAGSRIATVDIQIFLNTSITSRLLANPWSEALLLIDDPGPFELRVCGTQGDTETSPGVCAISGTGTGSGVYSGATGRPNAFQGRQTAPNSITWSGVPIDPPGTAGFRVIRITNIRANANALGVAAPNATPTPVVESIAITPAQLFPVFNPTQTVAFIETGTTSSVSAPQSFSQCASQNKNLADDPSQSGTAQFSVTLSENFSTVFKKRNFGTNSGNPTALLNQNQLTNGDYYTETGFFSTFFPSIPGRGNLGLAGLADEGTRLLVNFQNIPAGVALFSRTSPQVSPINLPDVIRMVSTDAAGTGVYSAVAGNGSGIAPIPLSGGSGSAVFEVIQSDPNSYASFTIPIYAAYDSTVGLPAIGTGVVYTALAPLSLATVGDVTSPLPRFASLSSGSTAFTVNACACASDMSAPVSITRGGFSLSFATGRFQQNVTIRNTGGSFIAGPISLALDGLSSNATLANAAGATSCSSPSGSPFIAVNVGSGLAPGASASVVLQFTRTGTAGITYNTRILAGSGGR